MFGWCQEVDASLDRQEALFFRGGQDPCGNRMIRRLNPPRIGIPSSNTIHIIGKEKTSKKGIKVHKDEIRRHRNSQQIPMIVVNLNRELIDSATQTPRLIPSKLKSSSKFSSRYGIVEHRNGCRNDQANEDNKILHNKLGDSMEPDCRLLVMKADSESQRGRSVDEAKMQTNKQTRSTNFHFQNVSQGIKHMLQQSRDFRHIQSFHQKTSRSRQNQGFSHVNHLGDLGQLDKKAETNNQRPLGYSFSQFKNSCQNQQTFQPRYQRHELKNVSSQITISPAKIINNSNKFKLTPSKRAILMDRDTIVSKSFYEPLSSQRSLRIEESVIFQPQIMSSFMPIGQRINGIYTNFCAYLAKQKRANLLVSLKQLSTNSNMGQIAEQNLIYKEMEAGNFRNGGILILYQTHIDRDTYIFVKEPFEYILSSYLRSFRAGIDVALAQQIIRLIQGIIHAVQIQGLYLRRYVHIDDIVFVFGEYKIHSANIFKIGFEHSFPLGEVLQILEQQIMAFAN